MNNNDTLPFLGFSKKFLLFLILSKFLHFYHPFSLSIFLKSLKLLLLLSRPFQVFAHMWGFNTFQFYRQILDWKMLHQKKQEGILHMRNWDLLYHLEVPSLQKIVLFLNI